MGQGLVTSEGELWRRQRKLMQPAFHHRCLVGFVDGMEGCVSDLAARWDHLPEGATFDVHREMMELTFRIVGRTLFSTEVGAEAEGMGEALGFLLEYASDYAETLVRMPTWLPTPRNRRFARNMATVDRLIARVVAERRAASAAPDDLLGMLLAADMDDRQLRDELVTLALAGHETTANALTWTWLLLCPAPRHRAPRAAGDLARGGRRPADLRGAGAARLSRAGHPGVDALVPAGVGHRAPAQGSRRALGPPGAARGHRAPLQLHPAPGSAPVVEPRRLRSGSLPPRARGPAPPLRVRALRRGRTHLHRQGLRDAGGEADPGRAPAALRAGAGARPPGGAGSGHHAEAAPRPQDDPAAGGGAWRYRALLIQVATSLSKPTSTWRALAR
ncbi:MAG: cytochrome P450 [Deltaproteobacteria bacterium]|nr:cytochrome P450 [Deltaproteobacteria bacterium]